MGNDNLTRNKHSIYSLGQNKGRISPSTKSKNTTTLEMLHRASKENIKVTAIYRKMEQRKSTIPVKETQVNLNKLNTNKRLSRDFPPEKLKENFYSRELSHIDR